MKFLKATARYTWITLAMVIAIVGFQDVGSEIYKWTDENGNVIYSEKKPEGVESNQQLEVIQTDNPGQQPVPDQASDEDAYKEDLDRQLFEAEKYRTQRQLESDRKRNERQAEKQNKKNCELNRNQLVNYESSPNLVVIAEDGSTHRLDETERQARIKIIQSNIKRFCKE